MVLNSIFKIHVFISCRLHISKQSTCIDPGVECLRETTPVSWLSKRARLNLICLLYWAKETVGNWRSMGSILFYAPSGGWALVLSLRAEDHRDPHTHTHTHTHTLIAHTAETSAVFSHCHEIMLPPHRQRHKYYCITKCLFKNIAIPIIKVEVHLLTLMRWNTVDENKLNV